MKNIKKDQVKQNIPKILLSPSPQIQQPVQYQYPTYNNPPPYNRTPVYLYPKRNDRLP